MKRLVVISTGVLFCLVSMATFAQKNEGGIKTASKETKKELKIEKKEAKSEKGKLRKLEGKDINAISKSNFKVSFGDIPNVNWRRSDYFDEATFNKDGKEKIAFFDFDGNLVGTSENVTFADLPASGQKEIKRKYKDYAIVSVVFYDDNEYNETNMVLYGEEFDDEDNYFVELSKGKRM